MSLFRASGVSAGVTAAAACGGVARLFPIIAPDARIHYDYSTLSGKDKLRYEMICEAIAKGERWATLNGAVGSKQAFRLIGMVREDHPEVRWFDGRNSLRTYLGRVEVDLQPRRDSRASQDEAALAAAVEAFEHSLPSGADEYTIAKAAFTLVASTTRYDYATYNASDGEAFGMRPYEAVGALVDHLAVCSGFAKAVQLLLQSQGMMAALMSGEARSAADPDDKWGAHAWLAVRIGGRFYHIDPTWTSAGDGESGSPKDVRYDYFGLTDREIAPTHRGAGRYAPPPVCDSTMAEFYRCEGLFLRAWDERRYTDMVCRQLAAGRSCAAVKAADDVTYRKMVGRICDEGGWRPVLERAAVLIGGGRVPRTISVSKNPSLRTLALFTRSSLRAHLENHVQGGSR